MIALLLSDDAKRHHHIVFAIFLLAIISFLEQVVIFLRTFFKQRKSGQACGSNAIWAYLDCAFGIYYVVLFVMTGRALSQYNVDEMAVCRVGICYERDEKNEPVRFLIEDPFCR